MNELQVFQYQSNQIRTILDDQGNPWLVAKDIAETLGYADGSNPARLTGNIPEEWKGVKRIHTPGGEQEMLCLSEQGLYFFLARSDKPSALPFQKWIAGDVIPSIRKHGIYATPQTVEQIISDPDTMITLLQQLKYERLRKQVLEQENALIAPKAEFYDAVAGSRDAIEIGMAAKVLNFKGMGRNRLFRFLREQKILMKDNQPYQEYVDREYFRTIEQKWHTSKGEIRISIKTVIYQRGIDYIRKRLLEEGFEPVEQAA